MFDLRFLNNLKQKLTTGNRGSIYLNALPERYLSRLDLADLNWMQPSLADDFLTLLTTDMEFSFPIVPDGRALDEEGKESLNNVLRRLSTITIEDNDHFSEHGVKTFGFGYPVLLYRDKKDPTRVIKAPMFVWSLDIERNFKRANEWVISRKEDYAVISNVVLAAYLRNDAAVQLLSVYDSLLEDAVLDKNEIVQLASEQLQQLHPNLSDDIQQNLKKAQAMPIASMRSRQYLEGLPLEQAQIMWSGVFGLFKSQKESIINDLDYFIDHIDVLQQQILAAEQARKLADRSLMQHNLTVVDTDPSQQHLLHSLEKGNHLVIQGPPGTGKSQTLTGIIANILANEGTCLVVCEKKTALDVVYQNLEAVGLGELAIIIEDIYRDRSEVVDSVRERAQQQYPIYKTRPSYLRVLESCIAQLERLQRFHHHQLKPLLEDKTWTALVDNFLTANERYDKQRLGDNIAPAAFDFSTTEFETIFPIFEKGKSLLAPLGSLEHPFNQLHDRFFEAKQPADAKLSIQRSITDALRACHQTQALLDSSVKKYELQLEEHYNQLYQEKLALNDALFYQGKALIQIRFKKQLEACKAIQLVLHDTIQQYNDSLEGHFDQVYANKMLAIDKTAALIKAEIYGATDYALDTLKEAKEDIMAALYAYEQLLEKHFEDVYMEKMDWVDSIEATIEAGLATSAYYFKKNKGVFRAILHGVSSKYKKLEADKLTCIKNFNALKKLHKQYQYFDFEFIETKDIQTFTFEEILKQIKHYREENDQWHLKKTKLILEEVQILSSRHSFKAVPYKKEAQAINQHLSDFRAKILRNQLIPLEFNYDSLKLRARFDQLEEIERKVQLIKDGVDQFMAKNEQDWEASSYDPNSPQAKLEKASYRTAFDELEAAHKAFQYYDFEFIKLGRPKTVEDYYLILEHLSDYRKTVETWYPSRLPIIETYSNSFKTTNLYPQLQFERVLEELLEQLKVFVENYNQEQIFGRSFQFEKVLFAEQLEELKSLENNLNNWATNLDDALLEINKNWFQAPSSLNEKPKPLVSEEALVHNLESLTKLHQKHDYFDYSFEAIHHPKELLNLNFIKNLAHYRTWTVQWFDDRQTVIAHWLSILSIDNVSPHVDFATEVNAVDTEIETFLQKHNQAQYTLEPFAFENITFPAYQTGLERLAAVLEKRQAAFDNFEPYYAYRIFWNSLTPAQRSAYKGLADSGVEDWHAAFTAWYLDAMLQHHQEHLPDQNNYYQTKTLFQEYSEEFKKMLVAHSLRYWRSKQTQSIATFHEEKAPIKLHSLYNKRGSLGERRTSLRKIISTSPELFTSFFPVLLVSPNVCSSILPLQPGLFDVVIFDEASQLRLEDTFCALVRGKYKVVSGDSQQMPPSDYFQSSTILIHDDELEAAMEEEEREHQTLVNESIDFLTTTESLLDYALAEGSYKESFLEVHYRSKHPYLIDFSNAAFYGNRLTPMPTASDYETLIGGAAPIELVPVNGLYTNYSNPSEAEQIIDYLIAIAKPHRGKSCPSVGVATFNMHQRNLILEMIQKRAVEDDYASTQFQKLFMSGLFVKNLENIQGDERDILIISTTFGLRENGSFIQNFGPINRKKGYRLLNVIITRAKQKLTIFTSIPSNYYEGYRNEILAKGNTGKGILYAYLAYAKAVGNQDESSRAAILQLLYEHCLKKPVDKLLYQAQDNAFKERVADFLTAQFPNRVEVNYRYAGFKIPILVKDEAGKPKWAFDFDSFHEHKSEEAYAWDLFRETHLTNFGFEYRRIWSKDWWQDVEKAKQQLLDLIQ